MPSFAPVVTLTPNPALDETWMLGDFREDRINRVSGVRYDASGKGVNVSRLLRVLGVDAPAAGFAGGENGKLLRSLLWEDGVEDGMTGIAGDTRRNLTLQVAEGGRTIKINHPGPQVSLEEFARMRLRLEDRMVDGAHLALCGSLPPGFDPAVVEELLTELSSRGVRVCVDCESLDADRLARIRPFLVKPNLLEFETLVGRHFPPHDRDFSGAHGSLPIAGAVAALATRIGGIVAVTLGEGGVIAATPRGARLHVAGTAMTAVSTVGAGDAMMGGMLAAFAGWRPEGSPGAEDPLETALRLGVAAGAAKVGTSGTAMPTLGVILERLGQTGQPAAV